MLEKGVEISVDSSLSRNHPQKGELGLVQEARERPMQVIRRAFCTEETVSPEPWRPE